MRSQRQAVVTQARMLAEHARVIVRGFGSLSRTLAILDRIAHLNDPVPGELPRRELRTIVATVQGNLAHRWTVTELSRIVNLSASQLTQVFNASFGTSPMQTLARMRAERLAELLLTTDWTVQRCADAVGWFDPCYASRIMKRFYGVTPSEYRKAARSRTAAGL